MKIKFWGARGSIPVSGKNYNKYGGSTTCVEVRSKKNELVIVDAGSGIRLLGKELCVLAWAAEAATDKETLAVIAQKWSSLRPEERWWLFSMTVAAKR